MKSKLEILLDQFIISKDASTTSEHPPTLLSVYECNCERYKGVLCHSVNGCMLSTTMFSAVLEVLAKVHSVCD